MLYVWTTLLSINRFLNRTGFAEVKALGQQGWNQGKFTPTLTFMQEHCGGTGTQRLIPNQFGVSICLNRMVLPGVPKSILAGKLP